MTVERPIASPACAAFSGTITTLCLPMIAIQTATTGASQYTITNFSETREGVSNEGDTTKTADPTNPTDPNGVPQFEVLTNLVKRWTPEHLHEERLDVTLRDIRQRTREYFNRLFKQV